MKLIFKNKILLLLLLFPNIFLNAQKINSEKRKQFYKAYQEQYINSNASCEKGFQMLKYAQDNYETSLANVVLGECHYNSGDFMKSVETLRTAESFANKTDSTTQKLRILNMLIISYRRAGFIQESDENWKKMQKIALQKPPVVEKADLLYIQSKIYDIDQNYCKAADVRKKYLDLVTKAESKDELNNRYRFAIMSQLCYTQIKCGKFTDAQKSFVASEKLLNSIKEQEPIQLVEFYFMNKALLAMKENKRIEAKKDFDSAYKHVLAAKTNAVIKLILNERIATDVDTKEEQVQYLKIINKITDSETSVTKSLANAESQKNKKIIEDKSRKNKIYITLFIFSLVIVACLLIYNKWKHRSLEKKYLKIIDDISPSRKSEIEFVNLIETDAEVEKLDFIKNIETEKEILKNLEAFEDKKLFNTKGISLAQLSYLLKTNTKYTTYILKKYRNADFYKYINTCRIDFIIQELHGNPQLLQYKISAIAELCGYSSHSQFANIFKNQKGISPSQFIEFLKKDMN